MSKDFRTISVRIPVNIFEVISETAKKEHRSITQQIVLYLEKQIEKWEEVACK